MVNLKNKIILITGAGKGRGRILAKTLAGHGAIIAANDISPINVEPVVDEINDQGGQAKVYIEDIAKKVGVQNLINSVEDDFGRIDILINHAAVKPDTPLLEIDEWDWHRVLDVNLTGAFLMTQSTARLMREQGQGTIIFIDTPIQDAGRNESAFIASMQGLRGFAQQAARELSPQGIQVHIVDAEGVACVDSILVLLEAA